MSHTIFLPLYLQTQMIWGNQNIHLYREDGIKFPQYSFFGGVVSSLLFSYKMIPYKFGGWHIASTAAHSYWWCSSLAQWLAFLEWRISWNGDFFCFSWHQLGGWVVLKYGIKCEVLPDWDAFPLTEWPDFWTGMALLKSCLVWLGVLPWEYYLLYYYYYLNNASFQKICHGFNTAGRSNFKIWCPG